VLFGILTENACPLPKLLSYFIIIGKLYLLDCSGKQILPNIYGFRAKIVAKYETEEKISNKEFFKRKWILTPYLSQLYYLRVISFPCCIFTLALL